MQRLRELPSDLRLGLSYEDFLTSKRDFRAIWATPIQEVSTHAPLGVLSLNIDRDVDQPFAALDQVLRPALREMAHVIAALASSH